MIRMTSRSAMMSVRKMSFTPASMLVVESTIVAASMPSGKRAESRSIAARTLLPTATALLPGCW